MLKKLIGSLIVGIGIVAGIAFATVTNTYTPTRATTDGNTTEYSFNFKVPAQGDLVVQLVNITSENVTNQSIGTNYTVTLSTSTPGGHIDFLSAPAAGQYVQLSRDIDVTQPTDIPAGGLFREVQIENALDRAILISQQQQEQINRAIKIPLLSNASTDYASLIGDAAASAGVYANASASYATNSSLSASAALASASSASSSASTASVSASAASGSASAAANYAQEAYENALGNLTVASTAEAQAASDDIKYMSPAKTKVTVEYAGAVRIPVANGGTNATTASGARTNLGAVGNTGDESIAGVKTFSSSPIVPTPTTDMQASTKAYSDTLAPKFYVGTLTRDLSTGSGDVSYTGIGFKPKAIICFSYVDNAVDKYSKGLSDGTTSRYMYFKNDTSTFLTGSGALVFVFAGVGDSVSGNIKTFDNDGFTITWSKSGSPTGSLVVSYICFG